jgi:diadenosine tetraphosphate (Ap4A) HIT family hydrolase
MVCPKEHREQATADFSAEEYLALQRAVLHRVAEAVREEVGAERMYVLTLGSNQGNAHVHWHVVPLPPGVPYEEQQYAALMLESAGALSILRGGESLARRAHLRKDPASWSRLRRASRSSFTKRSGEPMGVHVLLLEESLLSYVQRLQTSHQSGRSFT